MTPLPRHKTEFWGQEYNVRPMLLDHVFGDGAEWVWFEYMDDRPDYYVIRCPTGTRKAIDDRSALWYDDLLPSIENQIDEEAMDEYSARNWKERDAKGYVSETRRWPIPPAEASGSAWGTYTPSDRVKEKFTKAA